MANMAQHNQTDNYTQGYSKCTTATHERRTAEVDAAFLLPFIKKTDHILDAGCGPGTITTGLSKYASEGKTVGLDVSAAVLQKARALATDANVPVQGPGSVVFEEGNILEGLAYPDNTFDIVFCSQVFGHMPPPDMPVRALVELRRVLKPGGILATRDSAGQHFFPQSLDVGRLWGENQIRALNKGVLEPDPTGTRMPALFRRAGFEKVQLGAGTMVFTDPERRKWLAWRVAGQLRDGDPFYQSWLDVGITKDEIQQTLQAVNTWSETEDAWFAALQCEMLAWK
ncbi:S-adenosyl-L-methionine-dependent methyltransferase [Xylariaceae sp. AK1471]|nr:S-adenosyl-L-methionine-dependent methyltransferase [Xylariaceae sp. AK1471]